MSLRSRLDQIAEPADLFPELTNAQKETNRLLAAVSSQIYLRRKELGLTQTEFARRLSVSQPMVCQWESGEYNFTLENIAQILDELKLRIDFSVYEVESFNVIPKASQYECEKANPLPISLNLEAA